jgi:hypothetical protein
MSRGGPIVDALIDGGDLRHPASAVLVLEVHDGVEGPVEMVGDEGYLLVQQIEGVA